MDPFERVITVAEEVSDAFARRGHKVALIGAAAMAVHGYTRATRRPTARRCASNAKRSASTASSRVCFGDLAALPDDEPLP